jgi:hypothetical protein
MAFNKILAMLSQHLLNTYIPSEIPSSQSYKLPKPSRHQEVSLHALLHQVGALIFRNGDVKPVNKMQGLKELLVDLGSI